MMEDDYSQFTEWAKKSRVKETKIEKRIFEDVYIQMLSDDSFSDEMISSIDLREERYKTLHTKFFKNSKEED